MPRLAPVTSATVPSIFCAFMVVSFLSRARRSVDLFTASPVVDHGLDSSGGDSSGGSYKCGGIPRRRAASGGRRAGGKQFRASGARVNGNATSGGHHGAIDDGRG